MVQAVSAREKSYRESLRLPDSNIPTVRMVRFQYKLLRALWRCSYLLICLCYFSKGVVRMLLGEGNSITEVEPATSTATLAFEPARRNWFSIAATVTHITGMYIHKKCNQKNDSRNQKNIVSESKNSTLQEGKKELINNRRVEGGSALQKQKREETKSHGSFICAMIKRRHERLQLRFAITTQNMWFTVCSDRGPCVAIPLFRLCLWLNLPVGRMTFQSFDVRVRHWSSRSGLVFLGSCKMACRQVYMR